MNTDRFEFVRSHWLTLLLLCILWLPNLAGAAPLAPIPTGPLDAYNGTPDYYTTANWANSPPLAKFVDTLPGLTAANANNLGQYLPVAVPDKTTYPEADYYIIELREYSKKMHSDLSPTKLRGYVQVDSNGNDVAPIHYLGPIIVAQRDRPVRLKFVNKLPTGTGGNLFIPVDETVMGAGEGPIAGQKYTQNRADIHLHGGRTPWISDGTPHQWITPAGETTSYKNGVSLQNVPDMPDPGPGATTYYFTNQQSARLMFYHDHSFGITRLNVYAGEAAGYLITDQFEQDLVNRGILPSDQIPLIIQDKTFVDATPTAHPVTGQAVPKVRITDPLWNWGSAPKAGGVVPPVTGDLWMPHVYMPAQLPTESGTGGVNPFGRWMYGPWFYPATVVTHPPVANPYYDPNCGSLDPFVLATCETPGQPPLIPGTPNVSMGMEAFQDSIVVNGTAFPSLTVDPRAYRFRILNAAGDRFQNLSFYVADPAQVSPDTRLLAAGKSNLTEVKMLPASAALAAQNNWPPLWPTDGRDGGVPDPAFRGPNFLQIGTEGGFLPNPVVIEPQPITYIADPTAFWVGNVDKMALALGPAERADVIVDFSAYAGKTLILYNDAPAAWPARVPGYDYYTGAPDMRDSGGFGTGGTFDPATGAWVGGTGPLVGYAPNTRTVMQVIVRPSLAGSPNSYSQADLEKEFTSAAPVTAVNPAPAKTLFERSQDPIIVGQPAYSSAYPNSYFPPNAPWEGVNQINDHFLQFLTVAGEKVKVSTEPKGIHDEMGASFDPEYGRMSGNLGMQLPNPTTLNAMLVLYGFSDLPTEYINNSTTINVQVLPDANPDLPGAVADGTQIWKISHNGVDTHPIHFHIFDVQLINRVGWDGQILMPEPNELGWKDTVKISPLEDTIVAVRPRAPLLPFGIPKSTRPLNPTMPIDSAKNSTTPTPGSDWPFFSNIDWTTGQAYVFNPGPPAFPYDYYKGVVTNVMYDFGWEYVWHCHILSHEEMDMMRPIVLRVDTELPPAFTARATVTGGSTLITWDDPTPVTYSDLLTYGNPANEIGFNVYRSTNGGASYTKLTTTALRANTITYTPTGTQSAASIYKVEAFNAKGSTFSNVASRISVSVTATTAPFSAPANVNLTANVGIPPSGVTISSVEFFNGTSSLGSDTTGPYSLNWTNVMAGTYSITARVTDSRGAIAISSPITVTVAGTLTADFAITGSAAGTDIGFCESVTLTSTSLGSPDGFSWSIGGTSATATIPANTLIPGIYPFTLTVTKSSTGESASVTKNVTIVNHNPLAITGGPYTVNPGSSLTLNGSGTDSQDSCNTNPLSFAWNLDNKGSYDFFTANPTVSALELNVLGAGTHTVTFMATDSNGGIGTATTTVAILFNAPTAITVPDVSVSGSYTVSWIPATVSGVTYELQEATALTGAYSTVYAGTTPSFGITGKLGGTTYFYRVRAVSADGTLTTAWTTGANGCTTAIIAITSPANGGTVVQNSSTTITVLLPTAPAGSTLTKVDYYSGTTLVGTSSVTPYSLAWAPPFGVTSHNLTAVATYSGGQVSTSATVSVIAAAALPTITLSTPASGAVYDLGSTITLQGIPSNIGVSVAWVVYYDGTTMLGFTDTAPYSFSYTPLTAGAKSLTAKAYYNNGSIATSAAKSVTINGTVIAPASITVPASSATGNYSVSWAASATTGVIYTLQESSDPNFGVGTITETLNAVSPVAYTGKVSGVYYYRVKAVKTPMTDSAWATSTASTVKVNAALAVNGGVATASSTGGGWLLAAVNNGDRTATGGVAGAWADSTPGVFPDWVQITFNGQKTINEIDVFSLQDDFGALTPPTSTETFTKYGITAFDVQYWNGTAWATVTGGSISGNNLVWKKVTIPALTTDRIRIQVNASVDGASRIVEIEAYTTNAATVTLTSPANGATYSTAPASVTLTADVVPVSGWTTSRVDFYNGSTLLGSDATAPYSFTWTNVPTGTYAVTAQAIETLGAVSVSTAATITVGTIPVNVALASNGGVATASSTSGGWQVASVNNGDRTATGGASGAWADATPGAYPDWVQVTFSAQKTIDEIDVFTFQDNFGALTSPTSTETFTKYGITAFDVQYWSGTAWVTVTGGSITGNNLVWKKVTFPALTTDRIRLQINGSIDGYSRIVEIEAYTTGAAPAPSATVTLTAPLGGTNYPAAPASIILTADVVTANGWVTNRVDFYNGATLLGSSAAAPFSFNWTNVPVGTYSLTAQAVESLGSISASSAASVTVGTLPVNVALAANGGVATASSTANGWNMTAVNDGDRTATGGAAGAWADATQGVYPDWLQITFNGQKTINEIDVFTLQDNFSALVAPTSTETFSNYGITAFDVQYWNGSAWTTVTGGSIAGNNLVWKKVTFTAVTTDRIRVLVNGAADGYGRIVELEAYTQ